MSPAYFRVFLTFARNSLVRDMTYRSNFLINALTSVCWMAMNLGFYVLVFSTVEVGGMKLDLGAGGWGRYQFFVFIATSMIINSLVQTFFMPNAEEFSELIRTGGLDFALLKPIDTQFLISLQRIEWASLANFVFGLLLLGYALLRLDYTPGPVSIVLYALYILCGVAILYSLTVALAATSIWLGRNQSLYDFWFYLTNFSRYPMEIYGGNAMGVGLQWLFTFLIPVLVVVNIPARLFTRPLSEQSWPLALFTIVATALSFIGSRWVFRRALLSYRSASS
ncbi:MAG: ABC-2 family transporter protein [Planctomycetia bacterium]|nr:ABC-2 family transporter protein [Planctomycetia bacterium]